MLKNLGERLKRALNNRVTLTSVHITYAQDITPQEYNLSEHCGRLECENRILHEKLMEAQRLAIEASQAEIVLRLQVRELEAQADKMISMIDKEAAKRIEAK